MNSFPDLKTRPLQLSDLALALGSGWREFVAERQAAVSYAFLFAIIGGSIFAFAEQYQFAPMALPAAGGFMLIAPMLLCGYFSLADAHGEAPGLGKALEGFLKATKELFVLGLVCALLFMIWITDAATLYGFMIGRVPTPLATLLPPPENVRSFLFWSSVMGAALAFVIFAISAFSVPLLYYRRAALVPAIIHSVKTVFSNFPIMLLWGGTISALTILSILLLPAFLVVFPVLAYASRALYLQAFPMEQE